MGAEGIGNNMFKVEADFAHPSHALPLAQVKPQKPSSSRKNKQK